MWKSTSVWANRSFFYKGVKKNPVLGYYYSMENYGKHRYKRSKVAIDNVLEIRVDNEVWKRIMLVSEAKKKSYSWVVRYCLFRLIKRNLPTKRAPSRNFPGMGATSTPLHRHRLCLYGNDELYIRMTAALHKITMTSLVRWALLSHLSRLERTLHRFDGRFHELSLYWLGIKHYTDVDFHTVPLEPPRLRFTPFSRSAYF